MARTSAVANETLAYCTSCRMDLNHVIVAMKGDRIAKVQCLTCKKEHVYRAPKGASDPLAAPKKTRKSKAAAETTEGSLRDGTHSIEAEWEKLMTAHKDHPMKPYSTKGQFNLGD